MVVDQHEGGLLRRDLPHSARVDVNPHEDHANEGRLLNDELREFARFLGFFVAKHCTHKEQKENVDREESPKEGERENDPRPKINEAFVPSISPK